MDTAGVICGGADGVAVHVEGVVVLGAFEGGSSESGADFKSLGGGDGEHGFGEFGFEAVEDGFTESEGAAADNAFDDAADRVSFRADFLDAGDHFFGGSGVAGADDV